MRYAISGEDAHLPVHFASNGRSYPPSETSFRYTLRDNDGVTIPGHVDVSVTVTPGTAVVVLTLPAAVNTKPAGKVQENRFLSVSWTSDSNQISKVIPYGLIDWMPITGTPEDVRRQLGVEPFEILDVDVDLPKAYFTAKQKLADLDTWLKEGTDRTHKANDVVIILAALDLVPSLRLRIAQKQKSQNSEFSRFQSMDFDALEATLAGRLKEAVDSLTGDPTQPVLFLLSATRADAITGV